MAVTADVRVPLWPLTVERYERMVDAGIFDEDDRVELLNGQLSEKTVQGPEHAGLIAWLGTTLIRAIDPAVAGVRIQMPLLFAPASMPEPDIAIVGPGLHTRAHPAGALLVVEVAVTTRTFNLGVKAEIYAAAGIREYWVVDVPARSIHVHTSPSESGYAARRELASGSLRPAVDGAPDIEVEGIFALLD